MPQVASLAQKKGHKQFFFCLVYTFFCIISSYFCKNIIMRLGNKNESLAEKERLFSIKADPNPI